MSSVNKVCENCGREFQKRPRDSRSQWEDRAFCSAACSNADKKDEPPHLRFWKHVDRGEGNSCWVWTGVSDERGYGRIPFRASVIKAHRVSYEMRHGPIPEGMVICHVCDNPSCVNPNHLFAGTQGANMRDASRKGRLNPISFKNLQAGASGHRGAAPKIRSAN